MLAVRHSFFTEEEYLRRERESADKNEYFQGSILAMAGGSLRHNRLCSRLNFALCSHLAGKPCQPSSSDQRVMTPGRLYTYPDVAVFFGIIEVSPGTSDVATNPTVIVEVLSDSTREYDTGGKLEAYKGIPSVRHVILAEPDEARIVVVSRSGKRWTKAECAGLDAVLKLSAIGLEIPLLEIYAGIVGPDGPLPV